MKTLVLYGYEHAVPPGAVAYVYANPSEPARWLFTAEEIAELSKLDRTIALVPDDNA